MSVDGIRCLSTSQSQGKTLPSRRSAIVRVCNRGFQEKTAKERGKDKMLMPEDASTLDAEDMTEMMSRGDMYIR